MLQNPHQEDQAVTLCGHSKIKNKFQLIVKDVYLLYHDDFVVHTHDRLEIKEEVYKQYLLKAEEYGLGVLFWHSHSFTQTGVDFSSTDNTNDLIHAKIIKKLAPKIILYGNGVVAQEDFKARLFNKKTESFDDIQDIEIFGKSNVNNMDEIPFELNRNYRAFGKAGQSIISNFKVVIVGCGGLGWTVAQQLVGLGVRNLLLIDPDKIEITNLNRLPGAEFSKVGKSKVWLLTSLLKKMNPHVKVKYRCKNVLESRVLNELKSYDIIIGCVDSENVRLELNNFAVKYLKYYIDAGSEIILENGRVKYAGGQVNVVIPGITPCLCCNHQLDWKMISYENLNSEEKIIEAQRGYIRGVNEPSASVVSINGVVASSLVNEFMALATNIRKPNPYLFFDFMNPEKLMFPIEVERNENCIVCSRTGLFGYGDVEKPSHRKKSLPSFLMQGVLNE